MDIALPRTYLTPAPLYSRVGLLAILIGLHFFVLYQLNQVRLPPPPTQPAEPVFVRFIELPKVEPLPPEPVAAPPPEPRPLPKPRPRPAPVQTRPAPAPEPLPTPAPVVGAPVPQPVAEPAPAPPVAAPPVVATPAPPSRPREVSALAYARKPQPEYPRLSRRLGEQGAVVIRVEVDEHGQARSARVTRSSGFERLDQAALAAIRGAVFRPYLEDGRPVAAAGLVTIEFKLEN